jgi:hypothetical protein
VYRIIQDVEYTSGTMCVYNGNYILHLRTYERWGLKDGEGKLRIETSGGE